MKSEPVPLLWPSVVSVWLLAAMGGLFVVLWAPVSSRFLWLGLMLAGCVLATLVVQIIAGKPEGYLQRMYFSVGGALIPIVVAAGYVLVF